MSSHRMIEILSMLQGAEDYANFSPRFVNFFWFYKGFKARGALRSSRRLGLLAHWVVSICGGAILALGLLPGLCALPELDAQQAKVLPKEAITKFLSAQIYGGRIESLVRQYHVDFELTPELEQQLRSLGATDELLEALRSNYQPPPQPLHLAELPVNALNAATLPIPLPVKLVTVAELAQQHYRQGRADTAASKWDAAVWEFEESIRLQPKDASAHEWLGLALTNQGRYNAAVQQYKTVQRMRPGDAESYNGAGIALYRKGDLDGAIAAYRRALMLDMASAAIHNNLGTALNKKGDLDGAIREYEEALRLAPLDPKTHNNLGVALAQKKNWQGAIHEYREAIKLDGKDPVVLYDLGRGYAGANEIPAAITVLDDAIARDPGMVQAHSLLASLLNETGSTWDAFAEYVKTAQLNPADAVAQGNAGTILARESCWREAAGRLQRASALLPNDASLHSNLGMALENLGNLEGAVEQFQAALRLDEKNKDYRNWMRQASHKLKKGGPVTVEAEPASCQTLGTLAEQAESSLAKGMAPGDPAPIGSGYSMPTAINKPEPPYTEAARRTRATGVVRLMVVVDAKGIPIEVREVSRRLGEGLDESAINTVRKWKFSPGTLNGQPVPASVELKVNFQL